MTPLVLMLMTGLAMQSPPPNKKPPDVQEELPPEEDTAAKPKEYSFNPLQAQNEMRIGNFYFHRGKFRAAADRYREATKWNGSLAEAYVRLGEAEEKAHDKKAARDAYAKYLEIAPDAKDAKAVQKKLSKM
jgi:tetratricopeptide (TPR) repeat protein